MHHFPQVPRVTSTFVPSSSARGHVTPARRGRSIRGGPWRDPVNRARVGRGFAAGAAASLIAIQLFAGVSQAANTRLIYFGSDPNGVLDNGSLTFTRVTAGGATLVPVVVKNIDNQTLTHVVTTFPDLAGTGLSYAQFFGTNVGACATPVTPATTSYSCDFGNLAQNESRSFSIVLSASNAGTIPLTARIVFNESNNPNGGNAQIESATTNIAVGAGGCDLVATFTPPGQAKRDVGTDGCALSPTNTQNTHASYPATVVSTVLVEDDATATPHCPTGVTCFGNDSVVDIGDNSTTFNVEWTIQWTVPSNFNPNKLGVAHFRDNGSLDFSILFKKTAICQTATATGCFVSAPTLNGTTLQVILRTAGNGVIRGWT